MKFTFLLISMCLSMLSMAQDSSYVEYWKKDVKKLQGEFLNDKKEGEWERWNKKSNLIEKGTYQKGILIQKNIYNPKDDEEFTETNYYENGVIKSVGQIILESKEGAWTYYHEDGTVKNVIKYKGGLTKEEYKAKKLRSNNKDFNTNGYSRGNYLDEDGNKITDT